MTMVEFFLPTLLGHLKDYCVFSPWYFQCSSIPAKTTIIAFGMLLYVITQSSDTGNVGQQHLRGTDLDSISTFYSRLIVYFSVILMIMWKKSSSAASLQGNCLSKMGIFFIFMIGLINIPSVDSSDLDLELNSTSFPDGYHNNKSILPEFSLPKAISITFIYGLIFVTGVVGNICTCVVIARNKYMHTATNFYLFSLAVSDLLLLILGLPQEIYQIWVPVPYIFGEAFCIIRGLAAETSTNASILTITAFTVERYLAICHPLRSHTMSRLSRAVRLIYLIWIIGALCAVPIALQFGIVLRKHGAGRELPECMIKKQLERAFEVTTFVFFLLPMSVITALYILIGLKLRGPALKHEGSTSNGNCKSDGHLRCQHQRLYHRPLQPTHSYSSTRSEHPNPASINSRRAVVKMLVAVVVAFFVCWAPFHAQRLMAIYASSDPLPIIVSVYEALMYVSGVLYYVSATINPILYHIMSLKFRMAFKDTLALCFGRRPLRSGKFNSLSHFTSTLRSRPPPETTESTVMEALCREEDPKNPSTEQQPRCTNGAVKSSLIGVGTRGNSSNSKKRIIPVMDPSTSKRIVKTDSISNSSMQMVEDEAMNPVDLSNFMAQLNDNKYNGHTEMTNGNNHRAAAIPS